MKKIAILGSTGSIGTQALDIIGRNQEEYQVTVISGFQNTALLSEQIKKFQPEVCVVSSESIALMLKKNHPKTEFLIGQEGLVYAASSVDSDMVLNALVGMIGLEPTYAAAKSGKNIALANKEALVTGGALIIEAVSEGGGSLIPVDSEHCAIWQCINGNDRKSIKRLILTASGGPFLGRNIEYLKTVTRAQALNHPKWKMGEKISIDSATLMNKGLEVIEAHWLFDTPSNQIEVLIHPQSIIHSMVEFKDHAILAQLGAADMRGPIGYALSYPMRRENDVISLNFEEIGMLSFKKPDLETFKCLKYAYEALEKGGSYAVALNAANEELVRLFLDQKISFLDIPHKIQDILETHVPIFRLTIETILSVDQETRERVKHLCL